MSGKVRVLVLFISIALYDSYGLDIDKDLEALLRDEKTTINIYGMTLSSLTAIPMQEDVLRVIPEYKIELFAGSLSLYLC